MSLVPSLKNALPRSAQRPRPRPSVKAQVQTASLLQSPGTGSNGQQKDTEDHSDANELERQPLQTIDPAKKRLTWPFEGGNAVTLFQSDIERLDEGQFRKCIESLREDFEAMWKKHANSLSCPPPQ